MSLYVGSSLQVRLRKRGDRVIAHEAKCSRRINVNIRESTSNSRDKSKQHLFSRVLKHDERKKKEEEEEKRRKKPKVRRARGLYPQRAPPATYLQHLAGGHLGPRFSPNYPEALATSEVR
jgi:hypothetical protein